MHAPINSDRNDARPVPQGAQTQQAANPTHVGAFGSWHTQGACFAFGDGSIRFINETIDTVVYQKLGHRADGGLLNFEF